MDGRITNLDALSNIHRKPEAVLLCHEREKKKKYLQACLEQRRHFSPFVVPCDVMLGNVAKVILRNLARSLDKKSGKSHYARMSIAIVRGKPHIHATDDHASPRAELDNIPSGELVPACSAIRRTT